MDSCGFGNPEIRIGNLPKNTKLLKISMYDHEYMHDHGTEVIPYTGDNTIAQDKLTAIQRPCPAPGLPGEYEITIKALDEKKTVIGVGSKTKLFPEKQ